MWGVSGYIVRKWLNAKGYGGTTSDAMARYLQVRSGLTGVRKIDEYIAKLSPTGKGTQEKIRNRICAATGVGHFRDASRAFFSNTTLDF